MDKNVQGRVVAMIDSLCGGNKSEFCRRIGKPVSAVKDIIGGRNTSPSFDLVYAILSSDLGISPRWLILGDGDMLVNNPKPSGGTTSPLDIHHNGTVNINYMMLKETIVDAILEAKHKNDM